LRNFVFFAKIVKTFKFLPNLFGQPTDFRVFAESFAKIDQIFVKLKIFQAASRICSFFRENMPKSHFCEISFAILRKCKFALNPNFTRQQLRLIRERAYCTGSKKLS
jgi:hypothetical protein